MNSIINIARSEQEEEAEKRILGELGNSSNEEVHDQVRKRLLTPKRGINVVKSPEEYLTSDGCELVLPQLRNALRGTIGLSHENIKETHILDVGAGSGEVIDWFYGQEFQKNIHKKNHMHLIETDKKIIDLYREKVSQTPFVEFENHEIKIQDCYKPNSKIQPKFQKPFDFIGFMHAIHHLSDYTDKEFDPYADIISSFKFFYGLLKPGGAIFVTYYDAGFEFASINIDYHKERLSDFATVEKVNKAIKAREELLYDRAILPILRKEDSKTPVRTVAKIESHQISSSYYAKTLSDLAVIGLAGELLKSNNEKFDIGKFKYFLENIRASATAEIRKGERRKYGLCRAERGREALWRVESPLFICIIRKEIV